MKTTHSKLLFGNIGSTSNEKTTALIDTAAIINYAADALKHNETAVIHTLLSPAQLRFVLKKTLKKARVRGADCAVEYALSDDGYTQLVTIKKADKEQEKAA